MVEEWDAVVSAGKLSEQQCAPMIELLNLAGLNEVKRKAIAIYRNVLSDKKLRDNNFKSSVVNASLNFAFIGNPGS